MKDMKNTIASLIEADKRRRGAQDSCKHIKKERKENIGDYQVREQCLSCGKLTHIKLRG